jgi:hypothetical protein
MGYNSRGSLLMEQSAVFLPSVLSAAMTSAPATEETSELGRDIPVPLGTTQHTCQGRLLNHHKSTWKSGRLNGSLAERSHLADGTIKVGKDAASTMRKRISRMLEAPPSMRGIRKRPQTADDTFPPPQPLPRSGMRSDTAAAHAASALSTQIV